MKLFEKLIKVQKALKAPKGQYNTFGKYKYRSCEDILEAVKPLLAEQGLLLMIKDDIVLLGDRFYIKAVATIKDGEEELEVSAFAREEEGKKGMDGSQVTGTASSYARKYALNGLFLIDDTKDADTNENHVERENKTNQQARQEPTKQYYLVKGDEVLLLNSTGGMTPLNQLTRDVLLKLVNKPMYAAIKTKIQDEIDIKGAEEAMTEYENNTAK